MTDDYLFGDQKRIFLNTNLGCSSKCDYCYLPILDLELDKKPNNKISVENILGLLGNCRYFKKGKSGTILSIGCYSECWDTINRDNTINLINRLLEYKNPIQFATKQLITQNDFKKIDINQLQYDYHLTIYISSSTISFYDKYEQKTVKPSVRFQSFKIKSLFNIPMSLYIKPVLENITIKDIDLYIEIIKQYEIKNIIVGDMFSNMGDKPSPIDNQSKKKLYLQDENKDTNIIIDTLSNYCNISKNSIEFIKR